MAGAAGTWQDEAFVAALTAELAAGRPFALCTLLATEGTAPRLPGARMAILSDGGNLGTVGGGRIEQACRAAARELLDAGGAEIREVSNNGEGTTVAGSATVAIGLVGPESLPLFGRMSACLESRTPFSVIEDWRGPVPNVQVAPNENYETVFRDGVFTEHVGAIARLFIYGAGHVGRALCPVAARVGFVPVVCDPREGLAVAGRFPDARAVVHLPYDDEAAYAEVASIDYVVACAHSHVADAEVLRHVLRRDPLYVGCLGSRKKADFIRDYLGPEAAAFERVHMPVGIPIGAVTPDEIAVSIAAELVRARSEASRR